MTLHWWMHWFWVTAQIVVSLTSPTAAPTAASLATTELPVSSSAAPVASSPDVARTQYATLTLARLQQSYRIPKAIGSQAPTSPEAPTTEPPPAPTFTHVPLTVRPGSSRSAAESNRTLEAFAGNKTAAQVPRKKEAKLTWVQAFSKPPRAKAEEKGTPTTTTTTAIPPAASEHLTAMPVRERPDPEDPNAIRREPQQQWPGDRSAGGEPLLAEEPEEPHAIATAASILEAGLGDSTRLGRARGTFTSEFQRDQLSSAEGQRPEANDGAIKETLGGGANVAEIATITGSCLAIVILLSTFGSVGFIMYRRRYLNPPQALNSDKCSNPDSSGYIDDSTIRDNSEEMYSLDNDSFLNSLEAMTIQNYWTDSVKHTKL